MTGDARVRLSVSGGDGGPGGSSDATADIEAVPGFGFMPRWYFELFSFLTANISASPLATVTAPFNDSDGSAGVANPPPAVIATPLYSEKCDVVMELFKQGLAPFGPADGSPLEEEVKQAACEPIFDTASCLPATPAGEVVVIPCMEVYRGVRYDTSGKLILHVVLASTC